MKNDKALREQLIDLLAGGSAHAKFDDVVNGLPMKLRGTRPASLPHSPWMLLEHLRLSQWDILEFSRNSKYMSPEWPAGYWPKTEAPPNSAAWNRAIEEFRRDLKAMQDMVAAPKTDLFAPIRWATTVRLFCERLCCSRTTTHIIWDSS